MHRNNKEANSRELIEGAVVLACYTILRRLVIQIEIVPAIDCADYVRGCTDYPRLSCGVALLELIPLHFYCLVDMNLNW